MVESGVKIVKLADGDILRVPPGTDTGDLEVVSDEEAAKPEAEEPQVVKTEQPAPEPAPEPVKEEPKAEEKKPSKK